MVLNKRKPVTLIPPPTLSDNHEIFVMRGTNEVFADYEKYLKRFDWLNQKKFTDAVNGRSGLTYWDALESEMKSSASIETVFPEVLRDPILRKVQFSTISRMDELVNSIFDELKHEFFPGETVIVTVDDGFGLENGQGVEGIVREKSMFPMIRGADGSVQREPFSRYFVTINRRKYETLLSEENLRRDRKVFTKQNLRAFLKNSLQREAWFGAPWLVKEHLAVQYRLPMEIPSNLLQEARPIPSKQQLPHVKPLKGRRPKNLGPEDLAQAQQEAIRQQMLLQNGMSVHRHHLHDMQMQASPEEDLKPPPPPPIKYPIEDLDVAPKLACTPRPPLKFFTNALTEYVKSDRRAKLKAHDLRMESVGMLLEVWNTLNVQCEVYVLDSFTFDDFVDAMTYSSVDTPCELFEEIHCAVLKLFVDDKGKMLVKDLPEKADDDSESASDGPDESEISTPVADVPARSTRSRLSHVELATSKVVIPEKPNCAPEFAAAFDWVQRTAARDFEDGGWQVVVIGLLHQLSASPVFGSRCEEILTELAPVTSEPTLANAIESYAGLSVNLRVSALQMLIILTIRTDAIKDFLEACSEDMTDVRKRKIEHQREKKAAIEALAIKDKERRALQSEQQPTSPKHESVEDDATQATIDTNGAESSDPDDEAPSTGRSLRRGQDRKRKREEDNARLKKEKAEKAEIAKAQTKHAREVKKLNNEFDELKREIIHLEEKITECDSDLREANVQRTRILGKDRYCNRYIWFERNGQPFGGLPRSSTAGYGYANGRIWIQGPDEIERKGFIERTKEEQTEYQQKFHMSVSERRRREEGPTSLRSALEWGYYDDPNDLDNLIGWLDERGEREKRLRKELIEWRDVVVQYMQAHLKFKEDEALRRNEAEDELQSQQHSRIATRNKIHEEQFAARERCLKWSNTMAMDELGHLHSRQPKAKDKRKRRSDTKGIVVPLNRQGKPLSRQGVR